MGNPINPSTGLKFQVETDYRSPAGLEFTRIYHSLATDKETLDGSLGTGGWRFNWQRSVQAVSNPIVSQLRSLGMDTGSGSGGVNAPYGMTVHRLGYAIPLCSAPTFGVANAIRGEGNVYTFNKQSSGVWTSDVDVNDQLNRQTDATGNVQGWTYITADHDVEKYDVTGKLLSVTTRAGQTTTLTYSDGTAVAPNGGVISGTTTALPAGLLIRITDAHQHRLNLGYDEQSRIIKMTDPANGAYSYTYDTAGNLTSVTYPDGKTKHYLYENTTYIHALTGITDENGTRFATYAYDSNGRAISTEHAGGAERAAITYNTGSSNITDALGTVRTQTYQIVQGATKITGVSQPGGSGCGASASNQTYDTNGNVASRTDFKGNKTCYAYDLTRNLEVVRLEGVASSASCPTTLSTYVPSTATGSVERKNTTTWNATYRLPLQIAEPLLLTTYTYDTKGNLLTRTVQPTTDATGGAGLAAVADPNSQPRTSSYTYYTTTDARKSLLKTVNGPRTDVTDVTSYNYDTTTGNLTTVTNAL
ncbi:MAG: DUF6531 domain-containing protein, partial [Sideroxyarcus sp.]